MTVRSLAAIAALAALLAGCSVLGGAPTPGPSPSPSFDLARRPSSPARVRFVSPQDNAQVPAGIVHVVIALDGGTIVRQTSLDVVPTEGHIHFYVDNHLISMNYGTEQDVPLKAGVHLLTAEFVGADHVPFNPRVTVSITIDVTQA
jgi:hypothetical protein